MNTTMVIMMAIALLGVWALGLRNLLPSMLVAFFAIIMVLVLAGCALPPQPQPPTVAVPSDRVVKRPAQSPVDRVVTRTAGQATQMGAGEISRDIYQSSGGSFLGKLGASAVRNIGTEVQRWRAGP